MVRKEIVFKGCITSYTVSGTGLPVVLLHGFAEDGTVWNEQKNFLSNQFQVICPDMPGSGASSILYKKEVSIEDYADFIKAIMLYELIEKFVLIGHSMGGYISLAYHEKYPNDLIGLGLFHSTAYADSTEKIASRKKAISFIEANGGAAFLKTVISGLFYDSIKQANQIETLLKKSSLINNYVLIQYYTAMMNRKERTSLLKNIAIPVLIIAGRNDTVIPLNTLLEQSFMPGFCSFHILNDSGHMGMCEETALSNLILTNFLQSVC